MSMQPDTEYRVNLDARLPMSIAFPIQLVCALLAWALFVALVCWAFNLAPVFGPDGRGQAPRRQLTPADAAAFVSSPPFMAGTMHGSDWASNLQHIGFMQ